MVFGSLGGQANQVMIHIRGDDKDYKNALKGSDQATSSFASKMKGYAPMIGAAFAAAAVSFVAMSVKWAAAEEVVSRQTEALLKAQGIAWSSVSGELDAYMKQLERLTSYNDTDLQIAFNSMIAAGMSYTEAMESMNTVTSMSFSLNRDLASMALLVGKAYNGQTGELSRYGIVLGENIDETEKFTALQKYVADNFADATERSDTFQGQMDNLNNQVHNVAEAIGVELLPPLTDFLKSIGEWSDGGGAAKTVASFQIVGKSVWLLIDSLKVLQATEDFLKAKVDFGLGRISKMEYNQVARNLEAVTDAYANTATGITENVDTLFGTAGTTAGQSFSNNFESAVFPNGGPNAQGVQDGKAYGDGVAQGMSEAMAAAESGGGWTRDSAGGIAGLNISSIGVKGETRPSGDWTIGPEVASTRSGI